MTATKRRLVLDALAELGVGNDESDVQPEEMQTGVRRLEAQMAAWSEQGVRIGYRFAADPATADPDEESGIPATAEECVFLHLAKRLAPGFGKALSAESRRVASEGWGRLLLEATRPTRSVLPVDMPLGAGNRSPGGGGDTFTPAPDVSPLQTSDTGGLRFGDS